LSELANRQTATCGGVGDQQVHVVVLGRCAAQPHAEGGGQVREHLTEQVKMVAGEHPTPILGDETKCTFSAETTCRPRR
jgi:hypothetical protein